ncbi:MAG: tRNA (adenosine(37)-N6)-dimethylallyltransferase MiaA [Ferruginibacter sp.]
MQRTCIILAGPTASGKTDLAIALATHFNTSVISADSRQCLSELHIGVAKPSFEQREAVPHHFIDTHSIQSPPNAAVFETYALNALDSIFAHTDVAIVAGGTGLYINALTDGIDPIPAVPEAIQLSVNALYESGGLAAIQERLQQLDPLFAEKGEIQNPHRCSRALAVKLSTGSSILDFHRAEKANRPFRVIRVALSIPREALYHRINNRVDHMMQAGLLAEVTSLKAYATWPALRTVGYQELFQYLGGHLSLEMAIEKIKQHTRQYAKRQLTWFRNDGRYTWLIPDFQTILTYIDDEMIRG